MSCSYGQVAVTQATTERDCDSAGTTTCQYGCSWGRCNTAPPPPPPSITCSSGEYYSLGVDRCYTCSAGQYQAEFRHRHHNCINCPAGSITDSLTSTAGTTCTECAAGQFSASSQVACAAHTVISSCLASQGFVAGTTSADAACAHCPAGKFSAVADLNACEAIGNVFVGGRHDGGPCRARNIYIYSIVCD